MKRLPRNSLPRLTLRSDIWVGDAVRMRYVIANMPHGRGACLDAGCGAACLYKEIVEKKGYEWTGIDLQTSKHGMIQDINATMWENEYFQLLLCIDVLEHIKDYWKALSKLKRILCKNGMLILHVPNPAQTHLLVEPEKQEDHVWEGFRPRQLSEILTKLNFVNVKMIPTFNWNEAIVWDFMYAQSRRIPVDIDRLINFDIGTFVPYGILSIWRKK